MTGASPLGRRFRALKLWTLIHLEGVEAIRARIRRDLDHARWLAARSRPTPGWRIVAPVPLQTVCVRHEPPGLQGEALDAHTRAWCDRVNASGIAYLTAAVLDGRWMVRVAMGAPTTERRHIEETWPSHAGRGGRRLAMSDAETLVVDTLRGLIGEVDPSRARAPIALDASLTKDLALGSLERVELAMRLEQASGIELGETVLAEADTPRQIATAIANARARAPTGARTAASAATPARASAAAVAAAARGPAIGARTLVDALRWQVEQGPDRLHISLRTDDGVEHAITYGSLYRDACGVAAGLRDRGVVPGERVALLLRTEPAFFQAYFGILLAGGVPVPLYPPFRADQIEEYAARQAAILRNASARVLLTFAEAERAAALLRPLAPSLTTVTTVTGPHDHDAPGPMDLRVIDEDALALIQYTSGSTGRAQGGRALAREPAGQHPRHRRGVRASRRDDVGVSWLPLYHDMGLIGVLVRRRSTSASPIVSMSPLAFLAKPARWLEAISAHRGTISAAPNFAYDLCARKISDAELAGLDLSSWRAGLNGAEAVLAGTIERFTTRFAAARLPTRGAAAGLRPRRGQPSALTPPPAGRVPRDRRASTARRSSARGDANRRAPRIRSR